MFGLVVVLVGVLGALEVKGVDWRDEEPRVKRWVRARGQVDIPEPHSGQRRFFSRVRLNQRSSCDSAGAPVQPTRRSGSCGANPNAFRLTRERQEKHVVGSPERRP